MADLVKWWIYPLAWLIGARQCRFFILYHVLSEQLLHIPLMLIIN